MQNPRCWARKFDDCSSKLSGEHRISVNAWPGANRAEKAKTPLIFRKGNLRPDGTVNTDVPGGINRPITVNTLTAKVLCETHNNRLSATDHEAGELTSAIHAFWDMWHKRWVPGLQYTRKTYTVNGPLIERWFITTILANTTQDGLPIGDPDADDGTPTDTLVDIAFGKCPAIGHIGLYGAAAVSKNFKESLEFSFTSWSQSNTRDSDQTYIAGALCEYRGLRLS